MSFTEWNRQKVIRLVFIHQNYTGMAWFLVGPSQLHSVLLRIVIRQVCVCPLKTGSPLLEAWNWFVRHCHFVAKSSYTEPLTCSWISPTSDTGWMTMYFVFRVIKLYKVLYYSNYSSCVLMELELYHELNSRSQWILISTQRWLMKAIFRFICYGEKIHFQQNFPLLAVEFLRRYNKLITS